ncbi:Hypothetical protein, putative [Bodo saltans]|uniref:Geranylgeranyl transferase type-2 subunit alpha n=1 Tax=Bodo saltans TaxID=75058 RepID=A0A0S4JI96_BODSA|nr:Hypothetical protein, putative [Bodo saltans]|eukprot:CUG90035.1 Hypothetical protein, putative [Bodo saltans]
MHDQRKVREELDEKARQFQEEKIQRFRTVYDTIFEHYRNHNLSRDVLTLLDVLLEISPEQYTFFGYRRRILEASWIAAEKTDKKAENAAVDNDTLSPGDATSSNATDDDTPLATLLRTNDLEREYLLNTGVIMKDMKVYSAFVHRRWIFDRMTLERRRVLLSGELKKCEALLKLDERNFHAWGYRRWVTEELRAASGGGAVVGASEETQTAPLVEALYTDADEWKFTEAKINQNFSNYSGWHNRGLLLDRLIVGGSSSSPTSVPESDDAIATRIQHEMDLALKAFYCDPNDQSAWLYGEFILRSLKQRLAGQPPQGGGSQHEALRAVYLSSLQTMVACCEELGAECAQERNDSVQQQQQQQQTSSIPQVLSGAYVLWMRLVIVLHHVNNEVVEVVTGWGSPHAIVDELTTVDPLRAGMYRAMVVAA